MNNVKSFPSFLLVWIALGVTMVCRIAGVAEELPNSDKESKVEKQARIVILGDSITSGYGLEQNQAYSALLQKKLDAMGARVLVSNAGVSGDTTAGGSRRITWAMGKDGADALVIALGGNDGLRGLSPAQSEENLKTIIRLAREKSPSIYIILAGMQMPENLGEEYRSAFAAMFPKVAAETGVELLPFLLKDVGGIVAMNQDDRIHPNAKGQEIIAETVFQALSSWLKKNGHFKE